MSIVFQPTGINNLYALEASTGWIGYLFPVSNDQQYASISLEDSLNKHNGIYLFANKTPDIEATNFISSIWTFLNNYHSSTGHFNNRCFMWLNLTGNASQTNFGQVIAFTAFNYLGTIDKNQFLSINDSINMAIPPYCEVSITDNTIKISRKPASQSTSSKYGLFLENVKTNDYIRLGKIDTRGVGVETPITIPMEGANGGCLQFDLSFPFTFSDPRYFIYENDKYPYLHSGDELNQYTILESGIKYYFHDKEISSDTEMMYNLFNAETPAGFKGSLDFSDIFNTTNPRRSYFAFNGKNIVNQKPSEATVLPSFFSTNFGKGINLAPVVNFNNDGSPADDSALLVFSNSIEGRAFKEKRYYWTPQGDFTFNTVTDSAKDDTPKMLLCGLSGTETISFNTSSSTYVGDRISFTPKKPAYSSQFSALGDTQKSTDKSSLLTNKYTTAWANVIKSKSPKGDPNNYYSQPNNAPLFEPGQIGGTLDYTEVPSANLAALTVKEGGSFPIATSAKATPVLGTLTSEDPGYYTQKDISKFETEILNPYRKQTIASYYKDYLANTVKAQAEESLVENLTTTPQGFLVNLTSDKTEWKCLTLANNDADTEGSAHPIPLRFNQIESKNDITGIQSAFQTNEQFLVISDPGKPGNPDILSYYIDNFQDEIGIADWPFVLDIAHQNKESNTSSEFTNIMIFKFCSKSIEERIQDPKLWTDPSVFNNENTIPQLIKWIQNYIETARKSISSNSGVESIQSQGFKQFIDIIEDKNWHGILSLQVTLNLESLPSEIKAILAGIDTSRFAAHHIGIQANQIKTNPSTNQLDTDFKSSLFGMISYFNTTYLNYQNGTATRPTIYPKSPGEYDFQVLDLQVLFVNSLISDFNSKIQLNMNTAFDEQVISESEIQNEGIYKNSIILNGQYDKKNGSTSYTFTVATPNALSVSSTALDVVTITGIEMSTVDDVPATQGALTASGEILTSPEDATITTRFTISGNLKFQQIDEFDLFSFDSLLFNNLILDMKFNLDDINPDDNTPKKSFTFLPANITFNSGNSLKRSNSLVPNFPIELENLLYNNPESNDEGKPITTSSLGYMQVEAPLPTAPVGDTWYALRFNLNMGSIGALASKVGFNSEVILAWSPGKSNNQAQIYAKMPFSGGIAGTNFSIEGVLKFAIGSILFFNDPETNQYSMIFTEVGVSLLGKKLPPNGSTILYLFGNPDNAAASENGNSNLGWFGAYKNNDSN
ncbi:MAG: hypothetical protein MK066_03460 [Crocinitomicaceae bacterium]|nr:hypothetical protein [Crocinitomicaceae bacterium]